MAETKPELTKLQPPERRRTYHFAGGDKVLLENVTAFLARPSGAHRLETADGRKWIIPPGWLAVELDMDSWTL